MATGTLNPQLQETLTRALERERDELQQRISSLTDATRALSESQGDESGPGGSMADVASDLAEGELDLTLARDESTRLADVQDALERLADGSYGACEGCGQRIDPARLHALPWTRVCLACAQSNAT